jgi:hypothetical protein
MFFEHGQQAINKAEALAERFERRDHYAEVNRLRGVFLAAMGADETQIEASFCEAVSTAKEQKSVSLEKRAETTRAEYRRQKASASRGAISVYRFGSAHSGNCVFLLLVLVLLDWRHVTISQ